MKYVYSIYYLSTGRFKGQGCNSSKENVMAGEGEGLVEGYYDHATKMVVDGAVVDIPADVIEQEQIAKAWVELLNARNSLLQSTDWTQVPDAPVDQQAWATYRQELRDLPDNTEDPRNPVWPTKPN